MLLTEEIRFGGTIGYTINMEILALIPLWLACGLVIGFFAGKHYAESKEEDEDNEE